MSVTAHVYVAADAARTAATRVGGVARASAAGPVVSLPLAAAVDARALDAMPVRAIRTLLRGSDAQRAVRLSWWGCAEGGVRNDARTGIEVRSRWETDEILAIEIVPHRGVRFGDGRARAALAQIQRVLHGSDPLDALLESL